MNDLNDLTLKCRHHDYTDHNLLKCFIIGFIVMYIKDPINVS